MAYRQGGDGDGDGGEADEAARGGCNIFNKVSDRKLPLRALTPKRGEWTWELTNFINADQPCLWIEANHHDLGLQFLELASYESCGRQILAPRAFGKDLLTPSLRSG